MCCFASADSPLGTVSTFPVGMHDSRKRLFFVNAYDRNCVFVFARTVLWVEASIPFVSLYIFFLFPCGGGDVSVCNCCGRMARISFIVDNYSYLIFDFMLIDKTDCNYCTLYFFLLARFVGVRIFIAWQVMWSAVTM